jgi:DNA repair exonuclease SbcCD nuclease subunit
MTKILQTGDNHLRDMHLGRRDRGDDFTRAVYEAIEIGIEEKVSAILQCGDLFDTNRPSSHIIRRVLPKIQEKLIRANLPMYVVNGDHDKTDPPWATFESPAGCGIHMLENRLVTIPGTKVTVYGLDFIGKTKERFLEVRDALPAADILMWHTQVKEFAGFYGQDAVTMAELPTDKYRVIALGDIHCREYRRQGHCLVGYPGSTELVKQDEPLEKSVTILEVPEDGEVTERARVLHTRSVRVYRMHTDEDVLRVLNELHAIRDENPMVFGRFNVNIPNVMARFCATLDPDKAILRIVSYPENRPPNAEVNVEDDKHLEDFLSEYLSPGTEIFDVAAACLRPDAPVNDLVTKLIEARLGIQTFAS